MSKFQDRPEDLAGRDYHVFANWWRSKLYYAMNENPMIMKDVYAWCLHDVSGTVDLIARASLSLKLTPLMEAGDNTTSGICLFTEAPCILELSRT